MNQMNQLIVFESFDSYKLFSSLKGNRIPNATYKRGQFKKVFLIIASAYLAVKLRVQCNVT